MARFTLISDPEQVAILTARAKAGARNRALAGRMAEYDDMLRNLTTDDAVQIDPEGDETTRGLSLRVMRAAKRLGLEGVTTVTDGGSIYVSLPQADAPAKAKRKSPKAKNDEQVAEAVA